MFVTAVEPAPSTARDLRFGNSSSVAAGAASGSVIRGERFRLSRQKSTIEAICGVPERIQPQVVVVPSIPHRSSVIDFRSRCIQEGDG